jgi:sugar lactone lactonase YvrE
VTTLAGSTTSGSADGTGSAASFNDPYGVAVDSSSNVYVGDYGNNEIRKVTSAGVVTTLAGAPGPTNSGSADGTGASAQFTGPAGVAVDSSGNVYVADTGNNEIRKVTSTGVVTTLAGAPGEINYGSADGIGASAQFAGPTGVAVDSSGNIYVADTENNEIRKVTSAGVVTTLAVSTNPGSADGTGSAAGFHQPTGVAIDSSGNVYVADWGNNQIRKVTPEGVVTTLAGSTNPGSADGTGSAASFESPIGVAVDSSGDVYVADTFNFEIREVTPGGVVTTVAGSSAAGSANGTGSAASFRFPTGVAVDPSGNIYVADNGNGSGNDDIRKLTR